MAIDLTTLFSPYVDELFTTESKAAALTNTDFTFDGAKTVKIRKVMTSPMNDYGRNGPAAGNWSRFGAISELDTLPETFTLSKDRSFTFSIDKLNEDETNGALSGATALARQLREVVVPEVDTYTLGKIIAGAGTTISGALTTSNIYQKIVEAGKVLDDHEVPEIGRVLVVTPATLLLMKQNPTIVMETDIGSETVRSGEMGLLDGMTVLRVPANRLPSGFGFMIVHPSANVGVEKLAEYRIHPDPPGISGSLVEGRIVYDCFTLDAKRFGVYVFMDTSSPSGDFGPLNVSAEISADTDLLGKSVTDLQRDITVGNGEIVGMLKFVPDYSSAGYTGNEQSGFFLALHTTCEGADSITTELIGGTHGEVTLDSDGLTITRISDVENQSIRFTATKGSVTITRTFRLTGLILKAG